MKVRALTTFVDGQKHREAGDVFEMPDNLAVIRLRAGLVQRVAPKPETATAREPELAVGRSGKR